MTYAIDHVKLCAVGHCDNSRQALVVGDNRRGTVLCCDELPHHNITFACLKAICDGSVGGEGDFKIVRFVPVDTVALNVRWSVDIPILTSCNNIRDGLQGAGISQRR
jgi:hypothetical protein